MYLFAVKAAVCQIPLSSLYWERLGREGSCTPLPVLINWEYQWGWKELPWCWGVEHWSVGVKCLDLQENNESASYKIYGFKIKQVMVVNSRVWKSRAREAVLALGHSSWFKVYCSTMAPWTFLWPRASYSHLTILPFPLSVKWY